MSSTSFLLGISLQCWSSMVPEHGILMANKQPSKKIVLSQTTAGEFRFKSFLDQPMSELTEFQRSLVLAECAMISYLPIQECNIAAGKLGFVDGKFFNSGNPQAYWFQSEHDSVVVFRGTEPTEWGDIQGRCQCPDSGRGNHWKGSPWIQSRSRRIVAVH